MQNTEVLQKAMVYSVMSSIATQPQKSQWSIFNQGEQKYPQEHKINIICRIFYQSLC